MSEEEWRQVDDTLYFVSSLGRVRGPSGKLMKPRVHTHGYLRVSLGVKRDVYIHRLVCRAFHGAPPENNSHADHINNNRADNRAVNLRWLAPEANRALRIFRRGSAHHGSKLDENKVAEIQHLFTAGMDDVQISTLFGVAERTINDIRRRKTWVHVNAG